MQIYHYDIRNESSPRSLPPEERARQWASGGEKQLWGGLTARHACIEDGGAPADKSLTLVITPGRTYLPLSPLRVQGILSEAVIPRAPHPPTRPRHPAKGAG